MEKKRREGQVWSIKGELTRFILSRSNQTGTNRRKQDSLTLISVMVFQDEHV